LTSKDGQGKFTTWKTMQLSDLPSDMLLYELKPKLDRISLRILEYIFRRKPWPTELTREEKREICAHSVEYIQYFIDCKLLEKDRVAEYAAYSGNMIAIKWSNSRDYKSIKEGAIEGGHLEPLKYAVDNGARLDSFDQRNIARIGDPSSFTYSLDEIGCKHSLTFQILIQYHHLECLQIYLERDYSSTHACYYAAIYGHLDLLVNFHQRGYTLNDDALVEAAQNNHFECLEYAFAQGCSIGSDCTKYAASNNNLKMLKFLVERGAELTKEVSAAAAKHRNYEMLCYLIEKGCPLSNAVATYTAKDGNLEMLKLLGNCGNSNSCAKAAENGHLDCLKYLHEHGCSWSYKTCNYAAENDHLECLQYAIEHGCKYIFHTYRVATGRSLKYLQSLNDVYPNRKTQKKVPLLEVYGEIFPKKRELLEPTPQQFARRLQMPITRENLSEQMQLLIDYDPVIGRRVLTEAFLDEVYQSLLPEHVNNSRSEDTSTYYYYLS